MEFPYKNQKKSLSRLHPGEYILFAYEKGAGVCSGIVKSIERIPDKKTVCYVVTVEDINGEGDTDKVEFPSGILYRDKEWPE